MLTEYSSLYQFQFTPLREGRHTPAPDGNELYNISIHAPPRGATCLLRLMHNVSHISIHAPPRGATSRCRRGEGKWQISIHAPPRGATGAVAQMVANLLISIHAPPRGATFLSGALFFLHHFNSRPSARGDMISVALRSSTSLFQFTPLREGRRRFGKADMRQVPFQFTPLREGRLICCAYSWR